MEKIIAFGIAALVLLTLLTGCSNNRSVDSNPAASPANNTPSSETSIPPLDNSGDSSTQENLSLIVYGNTSGNITNGAIAAQVGDNIYYVLPTHPGYEMLMGDLVKTNTDSSIMTVLFSGDRPYCLNVVDGWIYYIANGLIYKVREDGTENTLITSGYFGQDDPGFSQGYTTQEFHRIYRMVVVDDWIYCRAFNSDRTNTIYRINVDSGEVEKLQQVDGSMNGFAVYDGWIYFNKIEDDAWGAYRVRTDGTENEKIADFPIYRPNIVNDKIYYLGGEDVLQIHRMDLDGTNIERIADGITAASINVVGDWIYYATGSAVYKINTDGTESIKLCDYPSSNSVELNVLNDWVYLIDGRESGTGNRYIMHRVGTNGGELQEVYDGEPSIQNSTFAEYITQGYEIEAALGVIALVHPDLGWNEADSEGFTARFDGDGKLIISTDDFNVFREVEGMTRSEISDVITAIQRDVDMG
jgi:hypothetical protein